MASPNIVTHAISFLIVSNGSLSNIGPARTSQTGVLCMSFYGLIPAPRSIFSFVPYSIQIISAKLITYSTIARHIENELLHTFVRRVGLYEEMRSSVDNCDSLI